MAQPSQKIELYNQANEQAAQIKLDHVSKQFGGTQVLKDISLTIEQGRFTAIVGKSGSGKSTLLRILAQLEQTSSGQLTFSGTDENSTTMMYQDSRLLPWKKVIDNVLIGLPKERTEKAEEVLKAVGLWNCRHAWPYKLSGGQQQRVALARALIRKPSLLLLDEPLSALDALTRLEMQQLIEKLWKQNGFTAVLVTHDVQEAVRLSDRVIMIEDGEISFDITIRAKRPRSLSDSTLIQIEHEILHRILQRT
ncbi:ATP-binding cassette domain-containing protein [Bacillus siamensis]|uniref:ATP-binding cassette domain-containing protein n=1 Tax=Bacillus siamensis TaxID=659243 RepID=UPI002E20FBD7|nr:ATP-binding cassette domain-containing protein [Bacillus siamensis]MED5047928.1 ATP-binding cassette domain-containing protein [Bacillus siamensis]MED5095799.1 ATP-binding cassette domain-containing protein [Bacillus siamensis]